MVLLEPEGVVLTTVHGLLVWYTISWCLYDEQTQITVAR